MTIKTMGTEHLTWWTHSDLSARSCISPEPELSCHFMTQPAGNGLPARKHPCGYTVCLGLDSEPPSIQSYVPMTFCCSKPPRVCCVVRPRLKILMNKLWWVGSGRSGRVSGLTSGPYATGTWQDMRGCAQGFQGEVLHLKELHLCLSLSRPQL